MSRTFTGEEDVPKVYGIDREKLIKELGAYSDAQMLDVEDLREVFERSLVAIPTQKHHVQCDCDDCLERKQEDVPKDLEQRLADLEAAVFCGCECHKPEGDGYELCEHCISPEIMRTTALPGPAAEEQYKCQSYYLDDNNILQDCTCGKCGKPPEKEQREYNERLQNEENRMNKEKQEWEDRLNKPADKCALNNHIRYTSPPYACTNCGELPNMPSGWVEV